MHQFIPATALLAFLTITPLCASALASPNRSAPSAEENLTLDWNGELLSLQALATRIPEASTLIAKVEPYSDWAQENQYHLALSQDARVILLSDSPKLSKKRMKLVESALDAFDQLMTPPDRSQSTEKFLSASWGVGQHRPDAEPIVLIEVQAQNEYEALCASIGKDNPNLSNWASHAADAPGFAEEQLSISAWQTAPDGFEIGKVWRPENELVNRLARMLLHRSFGPQPTWLRIAAAWRIEMQVMDSLYCFPYRQEFVGVGEHSGWANELKRRFKKRKKQPLQFTEFAAWKRNTWNPDEVQLSWGFVEFLARHHPGTLPAAAEQYRTLYKAKSTITSPDGSWRIDPTYQIPLEEQLQILQSSVGANLLEEASSFLRTWKRYKPKKAKKQSGRKIRSSRRR